MGEITNESRIIIVDIGQKKIGFLVDEVSQVASISERDIEAPPEIAAGCDRKFIIAGIGKADKGMVILLAPYAVLSEDEKDKLKEMSA
ncbi:chemotaxis protein CheW [Thermanaerosceptrum fracticalcis]|uniref:chemotaxis protein CheW n=1 Tax=Thermanaerosceptrum fracticalcis TaxID=1712410 RepID=UPI0013769A12|nr:chemotaxis protein CheW [Thermanaerosceptrum fracticalcis]